MGRKVPLPSPPPPQRGPTGRPPEGGSECPPTADSHGGLGRQGNKQDNKEGNKQRNKQKNKQRNKQGASQAISRRCAGLY